MKKLSLILVLFLSGCAGIPVSPEDAIAKASTARDRIEALSDSVTDALNVRAYKQICGRMSVDALYERFGTKEQLEAWATLCRRSAILPVIRQPVPVVVEPTPTPIIETPPVVEKPVTDDGELTDKAENLIRKLGEE